MRSDPFLWMLPWSSQAICRSSGTVYDGTNAGVDARFNTSSLSSLSANWTGFTDGGSGIVSYDYSIGTNVGDTDTDSSRAGTTRCNETATPTRTPLG